MMQIAYDLWMLHILHMLQILHIYIYIYLYYVYIGRIAYILHIANISEILHMFHRYCKYNAYCIIADRARPDRSKLCPWYPKLVDSKGRWLETYLENCSNRPCPWVRELLDICFKIWCNGSILGHIMKIQKTSICCQRGVRVCQPTRLQRF